MAIDKSVETLCKNLVSEAIASDGNRDENFGRKIKQENKVC